MIRPEQIVVQALADGASPAAGVRARVEHCRYYGHDAMLQIRPERWSSDEPLLARVQGADALAVGTTVSVTARGAVARLR